MRTGKAEQRPEHGRARSRSAAGRAAAQQGRAQADPTTYYSSCTNKPKPWSKTRRRLTASGYSRFFPLVPGIPLPHSRTNFTKEDSLSLGKLIVFCVFERGFWSDRRSPGTLVSLDPEKPRTALPHPVRPPPTT